MDLWWFRGTRAHTTASTGRRGERLAARRLRRSGYKILERNFTAGRDEADIIALAPDGATLVIVEVKTRTGDFAAPEVNIDHRKRRNLRRLASRMQTMPRFAGRAIRFDAMSVRLRADRSAELTHFVGAF